MHIEPGVLSASKILFANVAAIGALSAYVAKLIKPATVVKTMLAALFFSILMEIFHLPVGPSELHFVGASVVYFTFGFIPTLFGFAAGLAFQGLFFEPRDLLHLGVNSLSLMVPLIATHALFGRRFFGSGPRASVCWISIVKFDAPYYAGVVAMVGFWLALGDEPAPLYSWLLFAASYLPLVFCEPTLTYIVLRLLKRVEDRPAVQSLTAVQQLTLA
jgi:ABC-type Co2+ transport system permease subunit